MDLHRIDTCFISKCHLSVLVIPATESMVLPLIREVLFHSLYPPCDPITRSFCAHIDLTEMETITIPIVDVFSSRWIQNIHKSQAERRTRSPTMHCTQ